MKKIESKLGRLALGSLFVATIIGNQCSQTKEQESLPNLNSPQEVRYTEDTIKSLNQALPYVNQLIRPELPIQGKVIDIFPQEKRKLIDQIQTFQRPSEEYFGSNPNLII